jgi:hypothetical protein
MKYRTMEANLGVVPGGVKLCLSRQAETYIMYQYTHEMRKAK